MFGSYEMPFSVSEKGIILSIKKDAGGYIYSRECNGSKAEKLIATKGAKILINPVEPVNTPKEITTKLLIDFARPILIGPNSSEKIFVTFPVEIGVFVMGKRSTERIDVFTKARQKFTLYGKVRTGVICRHWKSEIYNSEPKTEILSEGAMELDIINNTAKWTEITKAVFSAHGMKIFYDKKKVLMRAKMRILIKDIAETDFYDLPLEREMKKSLELYTANALTILNTKFVMEGSNSR